MYQIDPTTSVTVVFTRCLNFYTQLHSVFRLCGCVFVLSVTFLARSVLRSHNFTPSVLCSKIIYTECTLFKNNLHRVCCSLRVVHSVLHRVCAYSVQISMIFIVLLSAWSDKVWLRFFDHDLKTTNFGIQWFRVK